MTLIVWLIFIGAALLEVGGDALIRRGLHTRGLALVLLGMLVLGGYGVVVNLVKWDFSKLLGVYVAVFALVSILCGRFVFREVIPGATWLGLAIIIAGGLVIQFGGRP
jgi:small multidrug resistance family-3 protein